MSVATAPSSLPAGSPAAIDRHRIQEREQQIERFLPLARQLARRYATSRDSLDDLVQVASVGLVKAVDRFDPERGTAFSSYAVPTILGEIKRYFRDSAWAAHVPRGTQERAMAVNQTITRLSRQNGRSPTTAEIAEAMGLPTEDVLEAMEASIAYDSVSLDAPRGDDEGEGDWYRDRMGSVDDRFELVDAKTAIEPVLKALPPRERVILHLRFVEDLTQSQIAERVGLSQMHVSRLIRRSLGRLQAVATAEAHSAG